MAIQELDMNYGSPMPDGNFDPGYESDLEAPSLARRSGLSGDNDVRQYFKDISRPPLLTPQDEVEAVRAINEGKKAARKLRKLEDKESPIARELSESVSDGDLARKKLAFSCVRLVVSIAKKYQGRGLSLPDLIQEGNVGLMRAIDRFNPEKYKTRLDTYATWWIRQAVTRATGDTGRTIRLPINQGQLWGRLRKTAEELSQQLSREPSLEEIAAAAGLKAEQVAYTLNAVRELEQLDALVNEEDDRPREELTADAESELPEEATAHQLLREMLDGLLGKLPAREADILRLRFGLTDGEGRTMEEIGKKMGYSRERIRQLQHEALGKLRQLDGDLGLADYLD
ncbi:hypothetical protein A2Z00_03110 [Candidatus Gottesmanbacteria bacterium RBG_13_45_10]|uniref:RNA polymerase sigma-70 domain-containing protein n=1 Tax=Candidatus Gottesmanbacteria bacterium RBG_13_45_10 TaxID=1798370 RepID=A0A1F5ZFZ5_9BACT|nr:MAG: hypothetical protein A2Z00_03110 [Candidatus Gottesmanbacteria bacterium RBG_13_45_10]